MNLVIVEVNDARDVSLVQRMFAQALSVRPKLRVVYEKFEVFTGVSSAFVPGAVCLAYDSEQRSDASDKATGCEDFEQILHL